MQVCVCVSLLSCRTSRNNNNNIKIYYNTIAYLPTYLIMKGCMPGGNISFPKKEFGNLTIGVANAMGDGYIYSSIHWFAFGDFGSNDGYYYHLCPGPAKLFRILRNIVVIISMIIIVILIIIIIIVIITPALYCAYVMAYKYTTSHDVCAIYPFSVLYLYVSLHALIMVIIITMNQSPNLKIQ